MDRKEKTPNRSKFANSADVNEFDASLLDSPAGREDRQGLPGAGEIPAREIARPLGGQPRSEITGRHDAGSGANETIDGMSSTNEALRQGAEDIPRSA
jgi:hypothetical protein